jgi:catechol 2,3-dioxygenase-like lactoylglutathione lyase family enzyme
MGEQPELGTVRVPMLEALTIQRMEHVGVVVDDLEAATAFFLELGLELQGEAAVEGRWVDRVVGLDGVRVDVAMVRAPTATAGLS